MGKYGLTGEVKQIHRREFAARQTGGPDVAELLRRAQAGQCFRVTYTDDATAKHDHIYLMQTRTRQGLTDTVLVRKRGLCILLGPRVVGEDDGE